MTAVPRAINQWKATRHDVPRQNDWRFFHCQIDDYSDATAKHCPNVSRLLRIADPQNLWDYFSHRVPAEVRYFLTIASYQPEFVPAADRRRPASPQFG
jgi:hypothetical protein